MEAIIYFQGGLSTLAGFFGIKMAQADQLPKPWVELFVDTNQQTYTSTPTAPGQFNPPGWDRPYDYGTPEHQEAEPYLFPEKEVKFKFWDLVNLILLVGINHTIMVHQNTKKQNRIYFLKKKLNSNFGILLMPL